MTAFKPTYPAGLPVGDSWVHDVAVEPIHFPYDGSVVAMAPVGTVELARQAVDNAVALRSTVAKLASHQRREWLKQTYARILELRHEFEQLLVLETGKPLRDCVIEVSRTLITIETAAEEVARLHGETVPLDLLPSGDGMIGFWQRKPIGVVIGITGFNYPLLLASHKIAPAIAAGCPVIVKTAPTTPLATLWMVHILRQVAATLGIAQGTVQLVTGDAEVGAALVTDPRIGIVSFTGSSAVGHAIAKSAAPRKVVLELGSNAALVVDQTANLEKAAAAVVRGGYYASGQACIAIQRVLVVESVAEQFSKLLATAMQSVVVGDPRDPATHVSALINTAATQRVMSWIDNAVARGARVLCGGRAHDRLIEPTVLLDVPDEVDAWSSEIFGPVVCVRTVPDLRTALDVVNASRFGLQASIFTTSLGNAFMAIEELEVGGVVVNEVPGYRSDTMPYGGVKDSGIGREGPRFAVEEFTVTRMAIIRPESGMQ
jgi:acyl-CoA reductase-like NAD-dependent aldehyde dehydrogenase